MTISKLNDVLKEYGFKEEPVSIEPVSQGLINQTWKLIMPADTYILQKVNQAVFKNPEDISYNIDQIANYLNRNSPDYYFVAPVKSIKGQSIVKFDNKEYYRLFPFVKNSFTRSVVQTAAEAFEAAKQFGKFSAKLSAFDPSQLKITIQRFHDLSWRYQQFNDALAQGNTERINEAALLISELKARNYIVHDYEMMRQNTGFRTRVIHHDTKISNVLYDENGNGICVIDLDTVMPGYFISDVGDMMRTYLCPVSEEEQDLAKIEVRKDFYDAIVNGYLSEMNDVLTSIEKKHFFYAASFMIYMQALRFLTDHINYDSYYGAAYPGHNFARAQNQFRLLQELESMKEILQPLAISS